VAKYAKGKVLDMGTGTGIQALYAAKSDAVESVLAIDIDPEAIAYCRSNVKNDKITFEVSDLFSNVKGKFDTIIFNPPYLPQDKGIKDVALYGGKEGYELTKRFFEEAGEHIMPNGKILIVFSSHTKKDKVDEAITKNGFKFKEICNQRIFCEDLIVYLVELQ